MRTDKIVKKINVIIAQLQQANDDIVYSASAEAEYFQNIIKDYNMNSYRTLFQISNSEFLIACIKMYNREESYVEIAKDVEGVAKTVDAWTIDDSGTVLAYMSYIKSRGEKETFGLSIIQKNLNNQESNQGELITELLKDPEFDRIINKYDTGESIEALYALIVAKYYALTTDDILNEQVSSSRTRKILEAQINCELNGVDDLVNSKVLYDFKIKNIAIKTLIREIKSHINYLYVICNKTNKETQKKIKRYQEIIKIINKDGLANIVSIMPEIMIDIDEEIALELYLIIEANMRHQYQEMKHQNIELQARATTCHLKKYLLDLGVNYQDISPKAEEVLYLSKNFDYVKETIKYLISLGIDASSLFNSDLVYILDDFDLENAKRLDDLKTNHIISNQFIKDNIGILLTKVSPSSPYKPMFLKIMTNINFLQNRKLNLAAVEWNRDILLFQIEELEYRHSLIASYKLSSEAYLYMLSNLDKIWLLDMMLENQIDLNLCSQIGANYHSLATIKKILLAQSIGENYLTSRNVLCKTITNYNNFYINDDELDDSLENDVPDYLMAYQNDLELNGIQIAQLVESLDEQYLQDNIYIIGDLYLSKNKLMRKLQSQMTISELINAIFYNTIAVNNQIEMVITIVINIITSNKPLKLEK